eukprot:CAMPEP_0170590002 /NCGR_PEP_ID=MMETSP0224-20130122/11639_1 /TAXON_ID=285029 /ORGANISM="Togula jolla, Strain CCCM 725" /LENGTH=219 /DNA_ID=CAMNT_0010913773 /DNA_START=80 /DNA_END=739 /DNA_ORIENTATION=+
MVFSRLQSTCLSAAVCGLCMAGVTFLAPVQQTMQSTLPDHRLALDQSSLAAATAMGSTGRGWGMATAGLAIGAHLGLAAALFGRSALRAKETAADAKLFEQVYMDYTTEYLKGPMYWQDDKLQGFTPDYPGTPMTKNGKLTSNTVGNLKSFSSNELAFYSVLCLAIGLYGALQFNYFDPQFPKVVAGQNFNVSYIVETLLLPVSFFMHIAAYIQKQNGK